MKDVQESLSRPQICSLMRGGIAERGGVRVGHRIIEINGQSVVAMAHEKIVQTLSVSVGEVRAPCATRCQFSLITESHKSLHHTGLLKLFKYRLDQWEVGCKPTLLDALSPTALYFHSINKVIVSSLKRPNR